MNKQSTERHRDRKELFIAESTEKSTKQEVKYYKFLKEIKYLTNLSNWLDLKEV